MNRIHAYHQFEKKRTQYFSKVSTPKELDVLSSGEVPEIELFGSQLNYLVVDFETTGLDASTDSILSVGWVEVNGFSIDLESAQHLYVDTAASVNADSSIDVRLAETRERYVLPEYNGHEALIDAIATAEPFLAQQTRLYDKSSPCIGKLYRMIR